MTSIIKLKKSSVSGKKPQVGDLEYGEVALNYADGKIHYRSSANEISSFLDSAQTETLVDVKMNSFDTSNLSEGSNLYYTTARVDSDIDAAFTVKSTSDLSEGSNLYYTTVRADSDIAAAFVANSTTDLSEGTNLYYTSVRVDSDIDAAFTVKSTSDLSEGSNLYYTTARADSDAKNAISTTNASGDGSLAYNSDTGVITYTGPSASEVRAHFSGGTGVTITDGEVAIGQSVGTTDNVSFAKITGDSAALDNIKLNSRATAPSSTFGTLYYDSDEQKGPSITLRTLENPSPGVTVNVGQEILLYVHNLTGQQISNGEAVYISGTAHGQHPQVSLAKSDTSSTGSATGLATMDIPDGAHGWVTRYGLVRDVNTSEYTAGDVLYLSADSAGQLTNTSVSVDDGYPQHVARVMTVDSTAGMVLVDPFAEHFEYLRIEDRLRVDGLIQGDSIAIGQIDFNTNWADSHIGFKEGALWYDPLHKNLNYYTDFDHPIEIGMQLVERVYNETGSSIAKGSPLYYSGNRTDEGGQESPTVALANATSAAKYNVQGLAAEDIPNNSYGQIIVAGVIDGLNTSGLNAGESFFAGLTDGAVQNAAPAYPNYPMCLGWVIKSDSSDGKVIINQQNHSVNSFRVQGDTHIGGELVVDGNFTVNGTQTVTSTENVSIGGNIQYLNSGNTIGEANTTFVGSGLDDAFLSGHYNGDSSTKSFFVKIDGTGTPDTFEWGFDSNVGTEATGVAITGAEQALTAGISIDFGATTGHTLGDKWTGAAAALNIDTGFFSNKNEGDAGDGYTHVGMYWDATENEWTFVGQYDSEPEAPINRASSSFQYGDVRGKDFYGTTFNGALSGNAATATRLQTARNFSLTGDITASNVSFDGTGNLQLTTAYNPGSIVNADINASAAIADTKLATISTSGKVQNSATTATDANTGSTIVARDVTGDFSAGTITADLVGNASSADTLSTSRNFSASGDATASNVSFDGSSNVDLDLTLENTGVSAGTYGSSSNIPVFTVDSKGRLTSVSEVQGTGGSGSGIASLDYDSADGTLTVGTDDSDFTAIINLEPFSTSNLSEGSNLYFTTSRARGVLVAGNNIGYDSATGVISFTGTLDHDSLTNYVANEHIDHTAVSISAGSGLTGGGNIAATRTINVGQGTGITVSADAISTNDGEIVHDDLSGFVANEHINHTAVSITAGSGLTGGGNIAATRTINVGEGTGITVTANAISTNDAEIVHDDLSGFVANEHIDHTTVSVTAGSGLTGGGTIAANRTINVGAGSYINVGANDISVDATHLNTASKVVARNSSGNFSAGTITADLVGNASTADELSTPRTISLSGDVTGSTSFDGSGNVSITATVVDDGHNHVISNVDGLQTALDGKLASSLKGANNGLAELDGSGKVPSAQLPSFVDDVLEYADESSFPGTGETGKLYVALDTNDVYRWSGSAYVKVSDAVSTADQATQLATARTIALTGDVTGSGSFDGSANLTITSTVANNSHTHTIANITGLQTALDGKLGATENAVSASVLNTARNIGGVSFDGSASINLPGVNIAGNQNTSGNAATASELQTARNIAVTGAVTGNANFDGSGNISISTTATSDPTLTLSGDASGSATFTNLGNATLNVTVANDSHTHDGRYYTETEADSRFVNVTGDTMTGRLTVTEGAGSQIILNPGASNPWAIELVRNGVTASRVYNQSGYWSFEHEPRYYNGGTVQKMFHEGFHPNADKWTTARTLSLSGDASGSVSWDGSSNATLSVTVANDSHTHDTRYIRSDAADTASGRITFSGGVSINQVTSIYFENGNHLISYNDGQGNFNIRVGHDEDEIVTENGYAFHDEWSQSSGWRQFNISSASLSTGNNITWRTQIEYDTNSVYLRYQGNTKLSTNNTGISVTGNVSVSGSVDGRDIATDGAKLDGIESGATADQTITAGAGLSGGGTGNVTLSHSDTSSQASVNNSNGTVIQDITLDTYGHITGINSVNLDGRYYTETEADSRFVNVTGDTMSGQLVIDDGEANPLELKRSSQVGIEFNDTSSTSRYLGVNSGVLRFGGSLNHGVNDRVFTDGYHPNADKWTTARTLSLSGDASGSVSWDGSANATLSVTVANDSHNHSSSSGNFTVGGDLTVSGGQVIMAGVSTRDKYRVWSSSAHAIGMQSGFTFGGLGNEYAMTFQMNNQSDRGFWWGDDGHSNAQGAMALTTNGKLSVAHSLRLGYGESDTTTPGTNYVLDVNGSFAATTKSFVIDHPTKPGMKLRHGSLEGPEDGVYVRGKLKGDNVIELPDYWTGLVHEDSITVQLTAIGKGQDIWVEDIADNKVVVGGDNVNCFYLIQAERKDVERWDVEYEG